MWEGLAIERKITVSNKSRNRFGKVIAAVLVAGAIIALPLAGCGTSTTSTSSSTAKATAQDKTITDMKGDAVTIPANNKTMLTVNSVATQMVLMLGGEDSAATLGQGFVYTDGSLNKNMYPDLGDRPTFTRDDATVDNCAALDPGCVLIDTPDTIATLRGSSIRAAYLSVTSPDTIIQAVSMIGDAIGGDAATKASTYKTYYEQTLSDVKAKSATISDAGKPTVMYLRSTTKTVGAGTMPDSWITAAGGINAAAKLGLTGAAGSDISGETILSSNPDIIVCESAKVKGDLLADPQFSALKAIQNNKVYVAPLGTAVWSMGTAEAPLMLWWAGTVINPSLYADVSIDQKATDFFQQFYGYTLTASDLNTIYHRS